MPVTCVFNDRVNFMEQYAYSEAQGWRTLFSLSTLYSIQLSIFTDIIKYVHAHLPFSLASLHLVALAALGITVPETFYFSNWTVSDWWAHAKRTVSASWTEFGECLWMMSKCRAKTEHKRERQVNGDRYVKALWTY